MDGDVDLARQQVLFDFAGEQPLAADILKRAILYLIACDLDHNDIERLVGQVKRLCQPPAGFISLGHRQR